MIKTTKQINPQDGLMCIQDGFLVNKVIDNKIYPNKKIKLKPGMKIFRNQDIEMEKQLANQVKRQIAVKISVKNNIINITDENNISINFEITSKERAQNQEKMNESFIKQFSKTGESDFYIDEINIESNIPFMPISTINNLRREIFEKLMQERILQYKRDVQKPINYTNFYKQQLDYHGNVHNNSAKEFYKKCNCQITEMSIETKLPQHQIELMRTKHCLKYALNLCKSPQQLYLEDEFGIQYPLQFDCKNCEMVVLSPMQ